MVPGDIVVLSAGSIVPGDCLLLELKDLFVDEAALTGESYPVDKVVGPYPLMHRWPSVSIPSSWVRMLSAVRVEP